MLRSLRAGRMMSRAIRSAYPVQIGVEVRLDPDTFADSVGVSERRLRDSVLDDDSRVRRRGHCGRCGYEHTEHRRGCDHEPRCATCLHPTLLWPRWRSRNLMAQATRAARITNGPARRGACSAAGLRPPAVCEMLGTLWRRRGPRESLTSGRSRTSRSSALSTPRRSSGSPRTPSPSRCAAASTSSAAAMPPTGSTSSGPAGCACWWRARTVRASSASSAPATSWGSSRS